MRVCNMILPVAALALWASQCAAVPVRVVFDWPADNSSPTPARVHIRAVRAVGPTNQSAPVETDAAANGAILDLNQGVWLVQASAPAYWSQGVEITIAAQAQSSVRVALWPAATLHGQIVAAEGELLPAALDIRLSGVPAASAEPTTSAPQPNTTPSHAELRCEIAAGAWTCLGPAGLFDARLEAAGYAPRYVWGVSLKAGESLDLGRTALRRSASVVGRAVRKDGSDPPGPAARPCNRTPSAAAALSPIRTAHPRRAHLLDAAQRSRLLSGSRRTARPACAGCRLRVSKRLPRVDRSARRRDQHQPAAAA